MKAASKEYRIDTQFESKKVSKYEYYKRVNKLKCRYIINVYPDGTRRSKY